MKALMTTLAAVAMAAVFACSTPAAQARSYWSVGVNVGGPGYWGGYPVYGPPAAYYRGPYRRPVCYGPGPWYGYGYAPLPVGISFGFVGH